MNDLLHRLRQRKIVQWAIAYLAGAWVLLQVLGLAAESYEWPTSVMRMAFMLIALGFVITLVLAWYHGERGAQKVSGTELLLLALLLAIGGGLLWKFAPGSSAPASAGAASEARPTAKNDAATDALVGKSIAVLPFVNMSGDANNEYFSDGITEEILNALAQIPDLKVAARTSAFAFKGKDPDLRKVGEVLDVATVLEGSVQRAGDTVRITAQLIDARSGYHLWSEKYDRTLTNIFAVEDEISKAIADKLKVQLGSAHADAGSTGNPRAHELYLRGLSLLAARGTGVQDAVDAFGKAVELDPQYAQAWGALAETEQLVPTYTGADVDAGMARAEAAAQRALGIDPDTASALVAMANVHAYRLEWAQAEKAFRRALDLAPGDAEALDQYAQFLKTTGQLEPALLEIERARQLDPLSTIIGVVRATILMGLHREADAAAQIETSLARNPEFYPARMVAAVIYIDLERHADAEAQLRSVARHLGVDPEAKAVLVRGIADPAARAAALSSLDRAPANADIRRDHLVYSAFLALLGERNRAIDELGRYAAGPTSVAGGMLWTSPFDPLRSDPRFQTALKKMGLPFESRADEGAAHR